MICGKGQAPSDDECQNLTEAMYRRLGKGHFDQISEEEFVAWAQDRLPAGVSSLEDVLSSFFIVEPVAIEDAAENALFPQDDASVGFSTITSMPPDGIEYAVSDETVMLNMKIANLENLVSSGTMTANESEPAMHRLKVRCALAPRQGARVSLAKP